MDELQKFRLKIEVENKEKSIVEKANQEKIEAKLNLLTELVQVLVGEHSNLQSLNKENQNEMNRLKKQNAVIVENNSLMTAVLNPINQHATSKVKTQVRQRSEVQK